MSSLLQKKLRIYQGLTITLVNAPLNYFETVGKLPTGTATTFSLSSKTNYVHLFVANKLELENYFPQICKILKPDGLLWISFLKKKNNATADLTRDTGWDCLAQHPMKYITLVSFDNKWSAFLLKNIPPEKKTLNDILQEHSLKQNSQLSQSKEIIVPQELNELLLKNKSAKAFFDSLSYTNRKEYVLWITSAKRHETKVARLAKTIEKLKAGKKNPSEK